MRASSPPHQSLLERFLDEAAGITRPLSPAGGIDPDDDYVIRNQYPDVDDVIRSQYPDDDNRTMFKVSKDSKRREVQRFRTWTGARSSAGQK